MAQSLLPKFKQRGLAAGDWIMRKESFRSRQGFLFTPHTQSPRVPQKVDESVGALGSVSPSSLQTDRQTDRQTAKQKQKPVCKRESNHHQLHRKSPGPTHPLIGRYLFPSHDGLLPCPATQTHIQLRFRGSGCGSPSRFFGQLE